MSVHTAQVGSERYKSTNFVGEFDNCHEREVRISTLRPGLRFIIFFPIAKKKAAGTVIGQGAGSTVVLIDGAEIEKQVQVMEGREKVVRIVGGPVHWSGCTPVVPTGEEADIEAFLGRVAQIAAKKENKDMSEQATALEQQANEAVTALEQQANEAVAVPAKPAKIKLAKPAPAAKAAAPKVKLVQTAPKKEKAPKELHECLCGCGEQVAGRFRMGHDARYYGWLRSIVSGDEKKLANVPPKFRMANNKQKAAKILADSGH